MRNTDRWAAFLDFATAFHTHSLNNLLLILAQKNDVGMSSARFLNEQPSGVRVYESSLTYLDEHPDRASRWDKPGDIGGWDVADGFRLSEPELGNNVFSEWRISVLRGEAYAVLRRLPGARNFTFTGPVWVIGDVPTEHPNGQEPSKDTRELLDQVEAVRNEPDSLLRAIELLQQAGATAR